METKICSRCKRELPIDQFRWKNKAEGKRHSQCKECQKAQEKQHYHESVERQKAVREGAEMQKKSNLEIVNTFRKQGCVKCGEKRPYVIDFHHRDPLQKEFTINHLLKSGSYETLLKELEKCDALCANCHREFHYLAQNYGISYEDFLNGNYQIP